MKKKLLWILPAALMVGVWLSAQVQSGGSRKSLAEITPGKALAFIEARDLGGIIGAWNSSTEKKTWLDSPTYQSYLRSKLALRLIDVQKAYADGVGVNPNYDLLASIAGGESAVAVYDVGKLELLYLTRLPAARLANNILMQGRTKFQARSAGGQAYYVKSTSDGTIAFAAVGDLLIAGTREDLVAASLQLLAGQQRPSVRQEAWFADSLAKAGASSDVRLQVNLERAVKTPHFQSYWIQQNISDMSQYYASVSDLQMGATAWTEQRLLLRRDASAAIDETGVAKVVRLIPADAGFYQAWAKPDASQVEAMLLERISPRGGSGASDPEARRAPAAGGDQAAGSEEDLEERVDLVETGSRTAFVPLPILRLSAGVEAMAQIQGTRIAAGGVMVAVDSALAVLGNSNWDENAVKAAVQSSAERAWNAGSLTWNRRRSGSSDAWELSGLSPMHVWTQGNLLIISNSASLLDRMSAPDNRVIVGSGAYLAGYRHSQENANYGRLMRHIDNPQIPQTENGNPRAPMLFSENLAGIGRILQRVDTATLETKDDGAMLRQTVTYRKRP